VGCANDDVGTAILAASGDLVVDVPRADVPWWSPSQLADRYGVTRQTIYYWIGNGRLPRPTPHPSGRGYYWLERDLPPEAS
jgi:predicted DNA-binding transcriptional regulator AlpA